MKIRIADTKDVLDIGRFVGNNIASSIYHDYRWVSVVEKSFGHKCYYLICEDADGQIAGRSPHDNQGESHAGWFQGKVNAVFKEELLNEIEKLNKEAEKILLSIENKPN